MSVLFFLVHFELGTLSTYISLVERNLSALMQDERRRIWTEVNTGDDLGTEFALDLQHQLDSGVTTRFLTAAALLATWALYEAAISQFAEMIRHRKEVSLSLSDLRGGFLTRARRYFDDVLRFDLHPPKADWKRITMLAGLRNAFAHANGLLRDLPKTQRSRVVAWSRNVSGLTIVDGCIVLSPAFVRESLEFMRALLAELVDRMQADGY